MNKPIDVKIANFVKKKLQLYIESRIKVVNEDEENEKKWAANFISGNCSFIHKIDNDLKLYLYQDSILSKYIYFSFEEAEIKFVKKFLKEGDTFFDIGANIGLFSLHLSNVVGNNGKIFAFEPTPETFRRLNENIEINGFKNILTENIGLSDQNGKMDFNISNSGFDAWNSFAKLDDIGKADTIQVSVYTLDDYIDNNNINKIDLIKLDVEGWELFVLKGGVKLLSTDNSPVLLVEFTETNAFAAGYYCGELYDFVKNYGYEWFSYDSINNQLIPQVKKLHYPYENLIAVKNRERINNRLNS
jgi:FkbM family methyltransferase